MARSVATSKATLASSTPRRASAQSDLASSKEASSLLRKACAAANSSAWAATRSSWTERRSRIASTPSGPLSSSARRRWSSLFSRTTSSRASSTCRVMSSLMRRNSSRRKLSAVSSRKDCSSAHSRQCRSSLVKFSTSRSAPTRARISRSSSAVEVSWRKYSSKPLPLTPSLSPASWCAIRRSSSSDLTRSSMSSRNKLLAFSCAASSSGCNSAARPTSAAWRASCNKSATRVCSASSSRVLLSSRASTLARRASSSRRALSLRSSASPWATLRAWSAATSSSSLWRCSFAPDKDASFTFMSASNCNTLCWRSSALRLSTTKSDSPCSVSTLSCAERSSKSRRLDFSRRSDSSSTATCSLRNFSTCSARRCSWCNLYSAACSSRSWFARGSCLAASRCCCR
mmetsp:Transcript_59477/g.166718  ORF Transcript_59477/g.166718 Transcript_59477/m.166718 type:complete len:401 (+) Transcript_59477:998-2200(+)